MLSEEQQVERVLASWGHLDVARAIAERRRVSLQALLGRGRSKTVGAARCELYVALRDRGLSYPEIGRLLNRDHTTVMYGVRKMRRQPSLEVRPRP